MFNSYIFCLFRDTTFWRKKNLNRVDLKSDRVLLVSFLSVLATC